MEAQDRRKSSESEDGPPHPISFPFPLIPSCCLGLTQDGWAAVAILDHEAGNPCSDHETEKAVSLMTQNGHPGAGLPT